MAAVAAFAASCGGGGAKAGKPAGTRDCKTQVAELDAFFHAMRPEPTLVRIDDDVHLAMRPELPTTADGFDPPVVTVTPTGLRYQDNRPSLTELGPLLVHEKLRIDDMISEHRYPRDLEGKIDSRHVWLVIDTSAPWGDIVKLTDMLGKVGFDLSTFVFGKPSSGAPPPRSSIDDELDKLSSKNGGDLATALANELSKVIATCPSLKKVLTEVFGSEGTGKAQDILDASGPAILACDCNLDVAAYRSLIWRTVGNPHPETGLAVTLAADGALIALPAATPWADAQHQLQPGTTVHLVAK